MKNNLTELVFILDMSGSMEHLTADTIGGFNSILKEQAEKDRVRRHHECVWYNNSQTFCK